MMKDSPMSHGWDQSNIAPESGKADAEAMLPWSGISDDIANEPTPPVASIVPESVSDASADADPRPLLALAGEPATTASDESRAAAARSVSEVPQPFAPTGASASACDDARPQLVSTGGGWTIPLLCAGIALIAVCVIIPICDNNRRIAYERERLNQELANVTRQVDINHDFLKEVSRDPTLAQRLAQRQMRFVRQGTSILPLDGEQGLSDVSPFLLVHVPPLPPLEPYKPLGGRFTQFCLQPKGQLYLLGTGLLLVAVGLVLGGTAPGTPPLETEQV